MQRALRTQELPQDTAALAERVDGILDAINEEGPIGEIEGRLTVRALSAINSLGLFGLLSPKCFGGWEAGAVDAVRTWEKVCEADGSIGWVLMACCSGTGAISSFLPDDAAKLACGNGLPIVGGQGAPRGRAIRDRDGYRLTGLWGYGSGILHSDYVLSSAMIVSDDGTSPQPRAFVVPSDQIEFRGNWDVLGLRATGSVDYAINDVFVPREFTFQLDVHAPLRGGGLIMSGVAGSTPFGHSAFALGVGRRILTEIAALANSSGGRPSALADGVGEGFQEGYGLAEGRLRAGRAFIYEVCEEFDDAIEKGNPISTRQITTIRLALNEVTQAALAIADFAFHTAGGVALRSGTLQGCIRNMWAGGQHRIVSKYMLRECARELLGLADGKVWGGGGLVNAPNATH